MKTKTFDRFWTQDVDNAEAFTRGHVHLVAQNAWTQALLWVIEMIDENPQLTTHDIRRKILESAVEIPFGAKK